jgi:hypothetical protein
MAVITVVPSNIPAQVPGIVYLSSAHCVYTIEFKTIFIWCLFFFFKEKSYPKEPGTCARNLTFMDTHGLSGVAGRVPERWKTRLLAWETLKQPGMVKELN